MVIPCYFTGSTSKEISTEFSRDGSCPALGYRFSRSQDLTTGFWTWQVDYDQVYFDENCAELLGDISKSTNCLGTAGWLDTIHPEDAAVVQEEIQQCIAGSKSIFWYTCRVKTGGGQWVWVLDRGCRQEEEDTGNAKSLKVLRVRLPGPPSAKKSAVGKETLRLLSSKQVGLKRLSASVGHDINNNLALIKAQTQLIRKQKTSSDGLHAGLDVIDKGVAHVECLASRLLHVVRSHSHVSATEMELDLGQIVAEALRFYRNLVPEGIRLIYRQKCACLPVLADKDNLFQVVCNLLFNAIDALSEISLDKEKRIRFTVDLVSRDDTKENMVVQLAPGNYAMLSICDNGIGVSPEVEAKIFTPFYTTKKQGKGSGLGLAIVTDIVRKMSGGVSLRTVPGKGAEFTVYFPLAEGMVHSARP